MVKEKNYLSKEFIKGVRERFGKRVNGPAAGDARKPYLGEPAHRILPRMPKDYVLTVPEVPEGFRYENAEIGGVMTLKVTGDFDPQKRAFLHVHDGRFSMGSAEGGVPWLVYMAQSLHMDGYAVEYTLAPDAQHPTQLRQVVSVY